MEVKIFSDLCVYCPPLMACCNIVTMLICCSPESRINVVKTCLFLFVGSNKNIIISTSASVCSMAPHRMHHVHTTYVAVWAIISFINLNMPQCHNSFNLIKQYVNLVSKTYRVTLVKCHESVIWQLDHIHPFDGCDFLALHPFDKTSQFGKKQRGFQLPCFGKRHKK